MGCCPIGIGLTNPGRTLLVAAFLVLLLGACAAQPEQAGASGEASVCHIVYDAGSSRTRLYIYESTAAGWVSHKGPRTASLADPVRTIRGKTMSDAGTVVDDIVSALEDMRLDGPPGKNGQPEWSAFDWKARCNIETAAVYATGGMRLAEQRDARASAVLWKMLNDQLSAKLGMRVTTRTLTGYEEGLFAWLATREDLHDGNFGVVEMGGASVQVSFPCPECETARQVKVKGRPVTVYSHSLLDWGQDEAGKKLGPLPACEHGAGLENPEWQTAHCTAGLGASSEAFLEIRNFIGKAGELHWYLSGAFLYMRDTDIDHFCRKGIHSAFEQETSCFRAVYLRNTLLSLGVPAESEHSTADWTLGAVICTSTQCLE